MTDIRSKLPSVSKLLESDFACELMKDSPRTVVTDAVRGAVDAVRKNPEITPDNNTEWEKLILDILNKLTTNSLRPIINATGVIVHTNLGRAPLASVAIDAIRDVAAGYSNLEYNLSTGMRGSRHDHCSTLLCKLTGAEDALVVNNCAAALVLALNTFAENREVIISRGELVEIGGSFRVPDIMERSNAKLMEVGTTNRTHLKDYEASVTNNTGAIVSVHRSNFVQKGFVSTVNPSELVPLAEKNNIPLIHDFGSGLMIDLSKWGLYGEPTALDAVKDNASVVLMSGDKLLGGPQSGIILGKKKYVKRMRENQLARALRVDKLTLSALEATLKLYYDTEIAIHEIPILRMITTPQEVIRNRAERMVAKLMRFGYDVCVLESESTIGGGAFPDSKIPSFAVGIRSSDPNKLDHNLRHAKIPVVGRILNDVYQLDLRSVPENYDSLIINSLIEVLTS
jgi:L-seryl-tRNA(Ser) seleniumtransferase